MTKSKRSLSGMPDFYTDINNRIAWLRNKKQLTFKEMSEILGIKISTLQAIEGERTNPNIFVLRQIIKRFNVTYDWLIDGKGKEPLIEFPKTLEDRVAALEKAVFKY